MDVDENINYSSSFVEGRNTLSEPQILEQEDGDDDEYTQSNY